MNSQKTQESTKEEQQQCRDMHSRSFQSSNSKSSSTKNHQAVLCESSPVKEEVKKRSKKKKITSTLPGRKKRRLRRLTDALAVEKPIEEQVKFQKVNETRRQRFCAQEETSVRYSCRWRSEKKH
jgi:hypothetical protein